MSDHETGHGDHTDEHASHGEHAVAEDKSSSLGKIALYVALGIALFFFAFGDVIKKHRAEEKQDAVKKESATAKPFLEPKKYPISGEIGQVYIMPVGYKLAFDCNYDYTIIDGEGNEYHAKAGKDCDIGTASSTETMAKTKLRFKTQDGESDSITVQFIPF